MNKELTNLIDTHSKVVGAILNEIEQLKNYGKDCDCLECEEWKDGSDGQTVIKYCLDCGGNLEW